MSRVERTLLPQLRERIRRIERAGGDGAWDLALLASPRSTGALPGGGLARGALHEILGIGGDEEDGALAAAFACRHNWASRVAHLPLRPRGRRGSG